MVVTWVSSHSVTPQAVLEQMLTDFVLPPTVSPTLCEVLTAAVTSVPVLTTTQDVPAAQPAMFGLVGLLEWDTTVEWLEQAM